MPDSSNRQTRKRLATRQKISDTASRLFIERGFDQVTVDQIAERADVSRMTVFNHFSRKEDMFFDLDDVGRGDILAALESKPPAVSPVEALRLFAHAAVRERRPYVRFLGEGTDMFMATILASEPLKARARAIRDEIAALLTAALARSAGRPPSDPAARLAASLTVATWTVAINEAYRTYAQHRSLRRANKTLLALVDQGARGVAAALDGTPYV